MSKTVDVETSVGTWTIKKPAAGPRNRAMIKAESGDGVIQYTLLMVTLLPKMVTVRASGVDPDIPIEAVLDGLEIEDYDALSSAGMPLVFGGKTEVKKKQSVISSTTESSPKEEQKESGSSTTSSSEPDTVQQT